MAPKKVNVAYISNESTRRSAGKKRATSAIKKTGELSVLCGVEACMVIALEDGSVQAWPSLPEAAGVIDRYRSMPEVDRCKKKMDGEAYIRERIAKAREQLRRAEIDNRRRETMLLIHDAMTGRRPDLAGLNVEQLVSMGWTTESLVKKIKDCIAERGGQLVGAKDDPPLPHDAAAAAVADVEAPQVQQGWVMEVVKAGLDLDALAYSGSHGGSGTYGSAGAGGDVTQLGNLDAWADPGTYFPHV